MTELTDPLITLISILVLLSTKAIARKEIKRPNDVRQFFPGQIINT